MKTTRGTIGMWATMLIGVDGRLRSSNSSGKANIKVELK